MLFELFKVLSLSLHRLSGFITLISLAFKQLSNTKAESEFIISYVIRNSVEQLIIKSTSLKLSNTKGNNPLNKARS